MNIVIERESLLKAIQAVAHVAARKSASAILSSVLLETGNGAISVTATDLNIESTTTAPCEIKSSGALAIPVDRLTDILRTLPPGSDLSISEKTPGSAAMKCGRANFSVPILPPRDFPRLPVLDTICGMDVPAAELASALADVSWLVSVDISKMSMAGVFLHIAESGDLRAVACSNNGVRSGVAWVDMDAPDSAVGWPGALIPQTAVQHIQSMLKGVGVGETSRLERVENRITVVVGETILMSQLLNYEFPRYTKPVPATTTQGFEVDSELLEAAAKRALTMSGEKGWLRLSLEEGGTLKIQARNEAIGGDADDTLDVEMDGEGTKCVLNGHHLLDILARIRTENVLVRFSGNHKPITINEAGDSRSFFLMMPLGLD